MNAARPATADERAYYVFSEPPSRGHWRIALLSGTATFLIVVILWALPPGEAGGFLVAFLLVSFFLLGKRFARQKHLTIRPDDFFTNGGDADQPVRWSQLQEISNPNTDLQLLTRKGESKTLKLDFLSPFDRVTAIMTMIRCFEIHRKFGRFEAAWVDQAGWKTERLLVRPLIESDRESCLDLVTSPEYRSHQLSVDFSREIEGELFSRRISLNQTAPAIYDFAVILEDHQIGLVNLWLEDFALREASLGIGFLHSHRGQGYATEAVRSVLAFAQERTGLLKVSASCFSDNPACQRVLEKSGMVRTGTTANLWLKKGELKQAVQFELVLERAESATPSPC